MAVIERQVTSQVIAEEYKVDDRTGHITIHARTHSKTANATWKGPEGIYGCSIQRLRDQFNGDVAQFEAWVAREHQSITGPPVGLVDALKVRKGKVIG